MNNSYQNMVNAQPVHQPVQSVGNLQNNLTQFNQPIQTVNSTQSTTIQQPAIVTESDAVDVVSSQDNNVNISNTNLEFDLPSVSESTTVTDVPPVNNAIGTQEENNDDTFIQDNTLSSDISDVSLQNNSVSNEIVSVRKYLGYMFLYSIPGVGIIFLIMNSFRQKNTNIKNLSKAYIIFLLLISLFIFIIYFIAVFVLKFSFNN